MKDISALISMLKVETKFHDDEFKKLFLIVLDEINKDMKAGGYDATDPTLEAMSTLEDYMIQRAENQSKSKARPKLSVEDEDT